MAALLMSGAVVVTGLDWRLAALGFVGFQFPWALIVAALAWGLLAAIRRRQGPGPENEAAFHAAVSSELRGGASLRVALRDAIAHAPELDLGRAGRYLAAGAESHVVAARLGAGLPVTGHAAAAALELATASGARVAAVFDALADQASFRAELDRERRALTAQARFSALIVGGGPLLFALVLLATGKARVFLEHGTAGVAVGAVGFGLTLMGLLAVALLMRRQLR